MRRPACAASALLLAACDVTPTWPAVPDAGGLVTIISGGGTLAVHPNGTLSFTYARVPIFTGARADVLLAGSPRVSISTDRRCTSERVAAADIPAPADMVHLNAGTLAVRCAPTDDVELDHFVQLRGDGAVFARLRIRAHRDVTVQRAAPFAIDGGGALYVAGRLDDDRILDDGSLIVADATVRLSAGTLARSSLANALPIPLRGNIIANSNLGLQGGVPGAPADARGGACFVHWMCCKPERICAGEGAALDDLSPLSPQHATGARAHPGRGGRGPHARCRAPAGLLADTVQGLCRGRQENGREMRRGEGGWPGAEA